MSVHRLTQKGKTLAFLISDLDLVTVELHDGQKIISEHTLDIVNARKVYAKHKAQGWKIIKEK